MDTQPQARRAQETCLLFKWLILLYAVCGARVPSSVQDPEMTPQPREGSPVRAPLPGVCLAGRGKEVCKAQAGGLHLLRKPPAPVTALHHPLVPPGLQSPSWPLTHGQRQCPPCRSPVPPARWEDTQEGSLVPEIRHFKSKRRNWQLQPARHQSINKRHTHKH